LTDWADHERALLPMPLEHGDDAVSSLDVLQKRRSRTVRLRAMMMGADRTHMDLRDVAGASDTTNERERT
jgi:hypothetical protein